MLWNIIKVLPAVAKIVGYVKWGVTGVWSAIQNWRYNRKKKAINEADSPGDFEDLI